MSLTSRPLNRAPAGTLAGVSAFQIHISDHEITTPGDAPNAPVADEPGAATQLPRLELVAPRSSRFEAGYTDNPLTDGSLEGYSVYEVPMSSLTLGAVERRRVSSCVMLTGRRRLHRARVVDEHVAVDADVAGGIEAKFANKPQADADVGPFKAGHAFGAAPRSTIRKDVLLHTKKMTQGQHGAGLG